MGSGNEEEQSDGDTDNSNMKDEPTGTLTPGVVSSYGRWVAPVRKDDYLYFK